MTFPSATSALPLGSGYHINSVPGGPNARIDLTNSALWSRRGATIGANQHSCSTSIDVHGRAVAAGEVETISQRRPPRLRCPKSSSSTAALPLADRLQQPCLPRLSRSSEPVSARRQQRLAARFPIPALAARALAGRVADPPGGQAIGFQVEQNVLAVGQADHDRPQKLPSCRLRSRRSARRPARASPACCVGRTTAHGIGQRRLEAFGIRAPSTRPRADRPGSRAARHAPATEWPAFPSAARCARDCAPSGRTRGGECGCRPATDRCRAAASVTCTGSELPILWQLVQPKPSAVTSRLPASTIAGSAAFAGRRFSASGGTRS